MTNPTLLGYLARFASFSSQSEVLCTQGLAYLLRTHGLSHAAMAGAVKASTGIDISDSVTWIPEAIQEDLARPDLEARTEDETPVVKIEAKLGAALFATAVKSYEADLHRRNSGEAALLVLVPSQRVAEVTQVVIDAYGLSGPGPWRRNGEGSSVVVISIISWDELFEALQNVEDERFRYELEQLRAMYRELSSDFIAPLASAADLHQWRTSETDFARLVDQATRRLANQDRANPMRTEIEQVSVDREPVEYRLRYVCLLPEDGGSCYSIGVRDSFAEWVTPIWMRFHKDTKRFKKIRQRVKSAVALRSLESGGHLWIPLDVPFNVSGEEMILCIIDQAERVLQVAYDAE